MVDFVKPKPPAVEGRSFLASSLGFNAFSIGRAPFEILTDINSIRDNIRNILFFRKGDYPDEPDFGIGLQDFIFDPADELLRTSLGQEIRRQIVRYEPRVTIRILTVTSPRWAQDSLQIDLDVLVGNIPLTGAATASGTFSLSQANPS